MYRVMRQKNTIYANSEEKKLVSNLHKQITSSTKAYMAILPQCANAT